MSQSEPEHGETAPDGALIWRGSRWFALLSIFLMLLLLLLLWFWWRLFLGDYGAAESPAWYKAYTAIFATLLFGAFAVGALHGIASSVAVLFVRRPMLRIDDEGVEVRNYMQLGDWTAARAVRWSEIEDVALERDPRTGRRVRFTVFISLNRDGKRSVWTLNAPSIGEYAKVVFERLDREWRSRGGKRDSLGS